jgi:hypothetical protein
MPTRRRFSFCGSGVRWRFTRIYQPIAREFPNLRAIMWTCPIILLMNQPTGSIHLAALARK